MRAIIDHKIYDTDKAERLAYWHGNDGYHTWRRALYRTKSTGVYFFHHVRRSFWDFIFFSRRQERIELATEEDAYDRLVRNLKAEVVERVFPDHIKEA